MKLKYQQAGRPQQELDAEWVVIYDDLDRPIIAVDRIAAGHIRLSTVEDPEFRHTLELLRVDGKPPVVKVLNADDVRPNLGK